ncbi:hypothetical protein [Mesorhizobium sp. M0138]|uniref:hypothetical protein n=1 Tax=Mesorhizobium sp. M0138 TaxID=2956891 RepID=UPI003335E6C1
MNTGTLSGQSEIAIRASPRDRLCSTEVPHRSNWLAGGPGKCPFSFQIFEPKIGILVWGIRLENNFKVLLRLGRALFFCRCDRMFGELDHGMISPQSLPQRVLLTASQESCQMSKSFHNNVIPLMALCLMSDIVEDPTRSAAMTA